MERMDVTLTEWIALNHVIKWLIDKADEAQKDYDEDEDNTSKIDYATYESYLSTFTNTKTTCTVNLIYRISRYFELILSNEILGKYLSPKVTFQFIQLITNKVMEVEQGKSFYPNAGHLYSAFNPPDFTPILERIMMLQDKIRKDFSKCQYS